MRLDGLRLQLLGLFVLPVTLLVLAVAVFSTGIHRSAMRDLVASRDQRAAASAAAAVNQTLVSRLSLARLAATHLASGNVGPTELVANDSFSGAFSVGLSILDESGNVLASAGRFQIGEPMAAELPTWDDGDIFLHEQDSERLVLFVGREGSILAVGAAAVTDLIQTAAPSMVSPQSQSSAYIVAPGNLLVVSLGGSPPRDLLRHSGVQAALRGERGSTFLTVEGEEHVVAFAPIVSAGWGLVLDEPWGSVTSSVLNLSLIAPLALIPVLLLAVLALWFGARRVIEPLRQLEQAAADLPGGDPNSIAETSGGIAEIEQLRTALVRMAQRVKEAQTALKGYIGSITAAQEEERRRVARELHDESIQHWIALDQRLQLAASRPDDTDNPDAILLSELRQEVQKGITELRRISRGLRPLYLEDLGLSPAVEMLAREAQESLGAPVNFEVKGEPRRMPSEAELAVYRTVQEGLANAVRHAQASTVWITFEYLPDQLQVTVRDDGRGFDPPEKIEDLASVGHFGLMGMLERADALEGHLAIESHRSRGTELRFSVPYR